MSRTIRIPVLIAGAGTGGVAAALALARLGIACILTEPTDWVGGQLTSQAVPPDENRWIEGHEQIQSATRSYLDFRQAVREWYRDNRPLTPQARANPQLNPGGGWVSHLCFEPTTGHTVLRRMLAEFLDDKTITLLTQTEPVAVQTDADQITAVTVRHRLTGLQTVIEADYVLDATELGDLLELGKVEHHIGAEHRDVHGELHGRTDRTDPMDQQAISWCFAVEHRPDEDHTIARPANYEFYRDYVPPLTPAWPGKLFSWTVLGGDDHSQRTFRWLPWPQQPKANEWEMWRYRRIVDRSIYTAPSPLPDVALINMVQMDYFLKPTLGVTPAQQQVAFNEAKDLSLSFLYWMQTDAPRFDGLDRTGYPGLKLRGNEMGTSDGFAMHPYIREARRLASVRIVSESDVGMQQRRLQGQVRPTDPPWGMAECFNDSVGIGHYRLDLHPSTAMRNSLYVEAAPFRIPLSALVPQRVTNLLAAGKCLGVTHITNGCYRLHPVEWNVGESAAHVAAYCLATGTTPHQLCESPTHLRRLQQQLTSAGVPLAWPWENDAGL